MPELTSNQRVVALNRRILAECGICLTEEHFILDYCCGSGRHVREYLENGYVNVFGYDVFAYEREGIQPDHLLVQDNGVIGSVPCPDSYFDFIYSYSAFEHIQDLERSLDEIYRILKPGGVSLHNFPSKWRPVEPHLFIPFGGAFQSLRYYLFWARLGLGTRLIGRLPATVRAEHYAQYAANSLNYPSGLQLKKLLESRVYQYQFVEREFLKWSPGISKWLYWPARLFPPLLWIFRAAHTHVLLLRKQPLEDPSVPEPRVADLPGARS